MAFTGNKRLLPSEGMLPNPNTFEILSLVPLDTPVPEVSSVIPDDVRFVFDPRYRGLRVRVVAEDAGWSDASGVIGQGAPFHPDPSRRVLALEFQLGAGAPTKAQVTAQYVRKLSSAS